MTLPLAPPSQVTCGSSPTPFSHSLQAVPYLSGLPLSVAITASPEIISALVSKLTLTPAAASGHAAAASLGEEDGSDPIPLNQQQRQRPASVVAPPPDAKRAPQLEDSQPEDLWEEMSQPGQHKGAIQAGAQGGSQWPALTQRPRKMSV